MTGRYLPCGVCKGSPAVHNPHPLNDAYVGHHYRPELPPSNDTQNWPARRRDATTLKHDHPFRWVTRGRPYLTVNCAACVVQVTQLSEFIHDSELPSELCPYVDCEDHRSSEWSVLRRRRKTRREPA